MLERDLIIDCQNFAKSDAVAEVFKRLEQKFIEEWKTTSPLDTDRRESSFHMVRALEALRRELDNIAQSQKLEDWNRRLKGRAI